MYSFNLVFSASMLGTVVTLLTLLGGGGATLVSEYYSESSCGNPMGIIASNVDDVCFPTYSSDHYTSGECSVFHDGPLLTSKINSYGDMCASD